MSTVLDLEVCINSRCCDFMADMSLGTNVHAIIESWDSSSRIAKSASVKAPTWGPFVLSAHSHKALAGTVESLSTFLKTNDEVDLHELAWTLQYRRTHFKYRASLSATNKNDLIDRLDMALKTSQKSPLATQVTKVPKISILGVFTGQGAQWPSMGKSLFLYSVFFRRTITHLESILKDIPNPPSWSLVEELLREDDPARTYSTEISQPLCTALQVAFVDLLKQCGITFSAVVGHSSGEIAAAYASGVLSARDVIIIAYYRGYHCCQIREISRRSGKMMAVGMTPQDAQKLCSQPCFLGRIVVAAENSRFSVTLSGDFDAIDEAKIMLDQDAVFARILKVDSAYHSHHMEIVREPYLTSLKKADVQPMRHCFAGTCNWYSSVYSLKSGKEMSTPTAFEDEYWVDNMVNSVLFHQAITSAVQKEDLDLALEIGPHPSLKGSAIDTIKSVSGRDILYQGVLERNRDALDCFANLLGYVWKNFDSETPIIDFSGFQGACNGPKWRMPRVYKGLPTYSWDHEKPMFKESRISKEWRMHNTTFHELLGRPTSSGSSREVRWRNILRFEDLEWLRGHQFQNQVLIPASGYLVMAADAAIHMLGQEQSIQLIELQDILIHNGVTLKEGYPGIDMIFEIKLVHEDITRKVAEFSCICRNADAASTEFEKEIFTGHVMVTLGPIVEDILPRCVASSLPTTDVNIDRFYFWMRKVGLQYEDHFSLQSIKRRLNCATVTTKRNPAPQNIVHLATLDSIIQGLYAAFSYPGDGRMWTTYLPKSFRRVCFNMNGYMKNNNQASSQLVANCYISESSAGSIRGDVDIFCPKNGHTEIQIQGAIFSSLHVPSSANDRTMFWKTTWKREISSITELDPRIAIGVEDFELHETCERTAFYYLKRLCEDVETRDIEPMEWDLRSLMHWAREYVLPQVRRGQYTNFKPSWDDDTLESLIRLQKGQNEFQIDLKLIHHLGSRLPNILRGVETALQVLKEDDMLDTLYTEGLGFRLCNHYLGHILDYLSHQYARMRVLEIGAGTGGSTATALRHLNSNVENYTFTDISPAFFSVAQTRFAEYEDVMRFQVLDVERPPAEQGFQSQSYDLIIAAHVLHATKSIAQTINHCRELLRPGGHMILLEITNPKTLRIPFLFSALPGWWLGYEDGRIQGPTLTEAQWNSFLISNSFSGVDYSLRDFEDDHMQTFSVMVTQATDDRVCLLRDPLSLGSGVVRIENLLIIGGHALILFKLATKIQILLGPFVEQVVVLNNLEDVPPGGLKYGSAIICFSGLEEPTFSRMNEHRLSSMQTLFRDARYMLLATRGCRDDDSYASMMVGVARTVSREAEHLKLKLVDLDRLDTQNYQSTAIMFSEMLLRMICLDLPDYEDILWTDETEVAIEQGAIFIPRVVPDDEVNDGFNSARHEITRSVCPTSHPIEVHIGKYGVYITAKMETTKDQEDSNLLQTLSSSLFRFACSDDTRLFYVCLAQVAVDDASKLVLTLSETNGSIIRTKNSPKFDYKGDRGPDDFLSWILTTICCESILLSSTGTIWIHNANDSVGELISHLANRDEIPILLTTSRNASRLVSTGKASFIHPRAAERECRLHLPRDLGRFVNMGADTDSLVEFMTSSLSHRVAVQHGIHNVNVKKIIPLSQSKSDLLKTLEYYCSKCDLSNLLQRFETRSVVKADQLEKLSKSANATSVISWTEVQSVPVRITPAIDSVCFAADRTYFLVGLTGEVGLSLCQWMADHGCKYLAIASRNPRVPPEIYENLNEQGVALRIFTVDVADMASLKSVHMEIVSSMPPIAGVANGALVVRDRSFDSMSLEDITTVFEPKVIGSENLDRLFFSAALDFFVLFGSVSSMVGHMGQANYHAANIYMSTLVKQRRKRGLAASIMHFGMLVGFGFLHGQAEASLEARFQREDLHAIPESDFHAVFAQAIISGRPDSGLDPEIIVGLGTEIDTPWRNIPRFSHCRVKSNEAKREKSPRHHEEHSMQSIDDRLKAAANQEQALSVLKEAVAGRLSLALGSPSGKIDDQIGLIRLGLDSLVAVEIRSWLLRVLQIDVPVLRFLSGSSLNDICNDALNDLPASLKSWVSDNDNDINGFDKQVKGLDFNKIAIDSRIEYILGGTVRENKDGTDAAVVVRSTGGFDVALDTSSQDTVSDGRPQEVVQSMYERIGEMSHAQAELYFLHEYLQNNAYNVAYYGRFDGQIDTKRLEKALWLVGKQHEALRSAYFLDKATAKPVQAVLSEPRIILTHKTASGDNDVQSEINSVKDFKFQIEKGVVMKVSVMSHSPTLHTLVISHHHIALDGVAWSVFISSLAQAYAGYWSNNLTRVSQSIDMARRKLNEHSLELLQDDLMFWEDIYRTIPEPLPLFPFAKHKTRPAIADHNVDINNFRLASDMHRMVEITAARIGVTPFHFYFATFVTFLSRCVGVGDVAIGVVDANRTSAEDIGTIGYFLNMLPVRIVIDHSESFDAVAKRSFNATLAAMTHSHPSLDAIIGRLGVSRSKGHHPLFQVAINYRKSPLDETDFGVDGKIQWDGGVPGGSPYDMLLNVVATPNSSVVSMITQRILYRASDGVLMLKWYTRVLQALVRDPQCEIMRCPISNDADISDAIELGLGDHVEVSWKGKITDRIDTIAATLPEAIAIRDEDGHCLTYDQMAERVTEIKRQLSLLLPSSYVAMLLDPVADAVCCVLAILGLDLVWIPLDTRNHPRRLQAVVGECRPQILICHDATQEIAKQIAKSLESVHLLNIDCKSSNHIEYKDNLPTPANEKSDDAIQNGQPAMILYTSGSTGVPKGVMLTHEGLLNQIYGTTTAFNLGREITLQQSPLGFDLMLDQIFLGLANGGTVIMVGKSGRGDSTHIANLMIRHGVTVTHFVPSEYCALLNYGKHILSRAHSWRYAMSGGEKLTSELRRAFRNLHLDDLKLINVYGPAEITLSCARGIVPYEDADGSIDYLRPSPNYGVQIMDKDMNNLPVGFPGEICISGRGIGLRYLQRPDESAAKFVQSNGGTLSSSNVRLYRSGDKGRILPDGTVEVLGRLDGDSQVKINGFRVELDEISNAIVHMSNGVIVSAATSLRIGQPSGLLVTFVVFDVEYTGDKTEFVKKIRSNLPLPPIMRPTLIVPIDKIPVTANGKTDRYAVDILPIPEARALASLKNVTHSLTSLEKRLKEIWEEVLSTQTVQLFRNSSHQKLTIQSTSDFFQVGGSSILMIKLKALIETHFGVMISMPELFHASTLYGMAALVEDDSNKTQGDATVQTKRSFLTPKGSQSRMDWNLEIASLLDGLHVPYSNPSPNKYSNGDGGLIVVLTGATGFIGRHLLSRLVEDPRVAQIHCIAIRPDTTGTRRHVSVKSDKIVEYTGDLSALDLGLSGSESTFLMNNAHCVIHNGADVSLLKTYHTLRRANVLSTRTLCQMATPRRIPLHYVSTASVAKAIKHDKEETLYEVPASPAIPDLLNSIDGYAASKWVSETLINKVAADNKLPAYIHRLAHVVGNDLSELDAVGMLTKYSIMMKALPRIDKECIKGQWDFVIVHEVAKEIADSAIGSISSGCPGTIFINHCSEAKVPLENLKAYLEEISGVRLEEMDMNEWLRLAREKGLHPLVYEFLGAFNEGQGHMVLPMIAKGVGASK